MLVNSYGAEGWQKSNVEKLKPTKAIQESELALQKLKLEMQKLEHEIHRRT